MRSPSERRLPVAVAAILAFGIALRTIQYGALGSMWLDELAIAINVTERSLGALLLRPLDLFQVAPPGFLALEKAGTWLLGPGEAGLRLFPWLAGIGALVLFWRVAARAVDGVELSAGLLAFAASPTLVWLGASAKQYSGDVFVTLLLLLLALRIDEERGGTREATLAGLLGGLAILASQPAVLVATGLATVLLVRRLRGRRPVGPVLVLAGGWAIGAALVTGASLFLVSPDVRASMETAWGKSFLIETNHVLGPPGSYLTRLYRLLGYLLVYVSPKSTPEHAYLILISALVPLGAWRLARRRPETAVLLAVPIAAGTAATLARLLPFFNRISLFMAPMLLIAAMAGVGQIRSRLSGRARRVATVASLGLFAVPALLVLSLGRPPYRAEEARPVLAELADRWRPGDELYVYNAAGLAMQYYGPDVEWTLGEPSEGDSRVHFREIDGFRGRPRVWFFHTHGHPCEPEAIRSYLEAIGTEIERIEDPYGLRGQREAGAYLYDLGDPDRLASADAETHAFPTATGVGGRMRGCGYNRQPNQATADG